MNRDRFVLFEITHKYCISESFVDYEGPVQFSSVQSLSRVQLLETPWTAAHQTSLSITNSWNLPKLMSIESVMPSHHLIFCHPLLLLPSVFPNIRVFSNELALHITWPKYWSLSIIPSNKYSGLISFRNYYCTVLQYSCLENPMDGGAC